MATAIIAGVGCSGGNGGNEYDNNYHEEPNIPVNPDIDPTKPDVENAYPAFYINEDFGGQKFVADKADWTLNNVNGNTEFANCYTSAQKFMADKVTELSEIVKKQSYSPLCEEIGNALEKYNQGVNMADNIAGNYQTLAPVFAKMQDCYLNTNNSIEYNQFKASYHKLAQYAYNNSLGDWKNSPSMTANREMKNLSDNIFVDELADANLNYDAFTVDKAKQFMNDKLTYIADDTGTGLVVLKKVVELALYNESLYGLNDFANICNVNYCFTLRETERSHVQFDFNIINVQDNISQQSIDDRTM